MERLGADDALWQTPVPAGSRRSEWGPHMYDAIRGYPLRVFLICLVCLTFANLDHSLFAFVLTEISEAYGWTLVERGWYLALTFLAAAVIVMRAGVLADRVGRRPVLLGSMLTAPFFVAALFWAPGTLSLLILRTLGFATAGAASPISGTIVVEEVPARLRGLFTGILQVAYPLGWFAASLIVPVVYVAFGWRYVFFVGLIGLPFAWLVWRFLREPPAWQEAAAEQVQLGGPVGVRALFTPEYRYRTLMLLLGQFLQVFAYGSTFLLTAYFRESRGWSAEDAIHMVGLSYGIGALGYVAAAVVGEFLMNRRDVIVLWCALGSVAFAIMIWLARGWGQTVIAYGAMTFFFYGATAVIFTFLAENFPAHLRATGVSFSGSVGVNLGIALGPLALSYAIGALGSWEAAYTVCGVVPVALAALTYLGLRRLPQPRDRVAGAGLTPASPRRGT
jgi:putative MFS transporter